MGAEMSIEDSHMAANAICHAAQMVQVSWQEAAAMHTYPNIFYKPKLFRDGSQWCALLGEDIQIGVCGFGDSPAAAMKAFDAEWYKPIAAHSLEEEA
jgi:hypothetical protein